MIMAWVLYIDEKGKTKFQELQSNSGYTSTDPTDWGLGSGCEVRLVLQSGSFIQAWVDGVEVRKW